MEQTNRRASIPILHVRGTHFEVGFDIGRTFQTLIESTLAKNKHLNEVLVEKYHSDKVRRTYEKVLKSLEKCYPQYIDELKGIAAGAKVPFFKLFLLHIDEIISTMCGKEPTGGLLGSTSVCCGQESKAALGHSQDYSIDSVNQAYIVSAHILEAEPRGRWGVAQEKFTALCLPGMLPGLYMGFNHHGFVFSVNTISTGKIGGNRTPRHFLCRALLSCANMFDACEILQDEGYGTSDGISVNMIFCCQEGVPIFHNAEVAPPCDNGVQAAGTSLKESQLSVLTMSGGENLTHCNKFLRLKFSHNDQLPLWSSNHRHAVLGMMPRVESISNVVAILGDQTDIMYSFFRDGGGKDDARTIVTGIFNISRRTWSIYTQNPKTSLPVVILPLVFK